MMSRMFTTTWTPANKLNFLSSAYLGYSYCLLPIAYCLNLAILWHLPHNSLKEGFHISEVFFFIVGWRK